MDMESECSFQDEGFFSGQNEQRMLGNLNVLGARYLSGEKNTGRLFIYLFIASLRKQSAGSWGAEGSVLYNTKCNDRARGWPKGALTTID